MSKEVLSRVLHRNWYHSNLARSGVATDLDEPDFNYVYLLAYFPTCNMLGATLPYQSFCQ
jgi:hypothetical protein